MCRASDWLLLRQMRAIASNSSKQSVCVIISVFCFGDHSVRPIGNSLVSQWTVRRITSGSARRAVRRASVRRRPTRSLVRVGPNWARTRAAAPFRPVLRPARPPTTTCSLRAVAAPEPPMWAVCLANRFSATRGSTRLPAPGRAWPPNWDRSSVWPLNTIGHRFSPTLVHRSSHRTGGRALPAEDILRTADRSLTRHIRAIALKSWSPSWPTTHTRIRSAKLWALDPQSQTYRRSLR